MKSAKRALVVGIDKYGNGLGNLEFCSKDASQMKACLTMPEFGFEVETLTDEYVNVTKGKLAKSLRDLFSQEASFYLFYYSGHGHRGNFEPVFVTPDLEDLDDGVSMMYLNLLISKVKNPNAPILLIIDCCYSGSVSIERFVITSRDIIDVIRPDKIGRVLIASCLENETSKENYRAVGSIFSYYLFEALSGDAINAQGQITVSGIFNYVSEKLKDKEQTPLLKGEMANMVLANGFEKPNGDSSINDDELRQYETVCLFYKGKMREIIETKGFADPTQWNKYNYKIAQIEFAKIVEWFNEHTHIKELNESSIFQSTLLDLRKCLNEVVFVQPGIETIKGVILNETSEDLEEDFGSSIEQADGSIGQGGFGKVWKVRDDKGNVYAYKICHPEHLRTPEMIRWFKRGYNTMKKLNHPNIVKVQDGDFTEAPLGFFMQYINGVDWSRYSPHKALELPDQIEQLLILARTIQYAHENNVYHCQVPNY